MKLRVGFVSNSSTTAFCIYGVEFGSESSLWPGSISDLAAEAVSLGLAMFVDPNDYVYLGRDYETLGDNETGREFKEETERRLKALFGEVPKCCVIAEGWYDG